MDRSETHSQKPQNVKINPVFFAAFFTKNVKTKNNHSKTAWADQGHFYKKIFPCKYTKKNSTNIWTDLGHVYKKNFFAAIKKIFLTNTKNFSSQL